MNISNEAVEAAATAGYEARTGLAWSDLDTAARESEEFGAQCALEASVPYMLEKVSTVAELDALPRFTVIRSDEGAVFERETMWHEAGSRDLKYSPDIALPATVLQLGWGEE